MISLALWPSPILADVGLPMLVFVWPASWIVLAPIVFVEAAIARKMVGLPLRQSLKISLAANLVSTLLGIPLAWVAALVLEMLLAGIGLGLHHLTRGFVPEQAVAIAGEVGRKICAH